MSFLKSSRRPTEKVSSDSSQLSFDLLSNLTYMACIAIGEPPRDIIFAKSITQGFKTSVFFNQVYLLTKKLGFQYREAFPLVAQDTKAAKVRALMLRFAGALSSGESEHEFLLQEARVERENYQGEYTRAVEALQKWGDAYAAFMVSSTLIMVVVLMSTMLFEMGDMFLMILGGGVALLNAFGVYVIKLSSPVETTIYRSHTGPVARKRAKQFLVVLAPVGMALAVLVFRDSGIALASIVFGMFLVPSGIYAYLDDKKVRVLDEQVPGFVRGLGNVTASMGSTLSVALNHINLQSTAALEPYVRRLQTRLNSHMDPELCWDQFRDETGSELVNRTTRMLVDGVELGGRADRVGRVANDYSMNIVLLRARRYTTALPFSFLVVVLHAAMAALLVFILEITQAFNGRLLGLRETLDGASDMVIQLPQLPIFSPKDMLLPTVLTYMILVVLTIANLMVPKIATGGHPVKFASYASIMIVISGLTLLVVPPIVEQLFSQ